jgi:DNA ligase 1
MRAFTALYLALDATRSTIEKRGAIVAYLRAAPPEDAAYAIWLLQGGRLTTVLRRAQLLEAVELHTGLPRWLIDDSYAHVGDLAETLALLVDGSEAHDDRADDADHGLASVIENELLPLRLQPEAARQQHIAQLWRTLDGKQRLLLNKLLLGGLRIGVAGGLLNQALAQAFELPVAIVAQRMLGKFSPTRAAFEALRAPAGTVDDALPLPFCLANALAESDPWTALGLTADAPLEGFQIEWKYDGIRCQIVRHQNGVGLFSRGEEWLDLGFPELIDAARGLPPGTVLDAELIAVRDGAMLGFQQLQKRINNRKPSANLRTTVPVIALVFDVLRVGGVDCRSEPLHRRRLQLEQQMAALTADASTVGPIQLMPTLTANSALGSAAALSALRAQATERGVEGLMLKRLDAAYGLGRARGAWWKWKLAPLTVDAVLLYAAAGHGRRAQLHTDYTLGLWRDDVLLPVAKAYSGLTDAELSQIDKWIRAHTLNRFGPVRQVEPQLVFEIAFEAVNRSTRHKSGVAVRFPRIVRWRQDKLASEADTVASLLALARG